MYVLESSDGAVVFRSEERKLRLQFFAENIVRVTFTATAREFLSRASRIVVAQPPAVSIAVSEEESSFVVSTSGMRVVLKKSTGALAYFDASGRLLMREPELGGRWLTPRAVMRNVFERDTEVVMGQGIDGARATVTRFETVFDREAFEAKLEFVFSEDEALFGLGSHEEGYANLRGRSRELYQQNLKAVAPHLVSTRGYSVLMECSSLMSFHDDALGSYWWCDCVDELDYYVIAGGDYTGVCRGYRALTGATPMLPKWAFGFVQSKERYINAAEMIAVVAEHRRRGIPLDVIVLDWNSWPADGTWGQKTLDPGRFPEPRAFTDELHAMHARLMVSVWPIMTGGCADQREMLDGDLMLGNNCTYNAFLAEARELYWKQAERGLFANGVDAWWCDCTEPFESDWKSVVKPEPHARLAINVSEAQKYMDPGEINAYSLVHSQGIYEGQRRTTDAKRVLNLTRSSYAGQHRYGTVTWNGDVSSTWETLRRSIAEGLNFCATGEAYWTTDAGGFFVATDTKYWFWRGDYQAGTRGLSPLVALEPDANDAGCKDLGFWELHVRWMQWSCLMPMFRSHGTDAAREVWRFGDEGSPFYDALVECIRLRYRLIEYIYSLAAGVTREGAAMVQALALTFPHDRATHGIRDQYMFGTALMVCPVTQAMYFEKDSRRLENAARERLVYLPVGTAWFDFWSGAMYEGGQTVVAEAPLERIPLFVRAGSIVPMVEAMQFVDEVRDAAIELHVYAGADAAFTLYEDAGDGYAYERGECALVHVQWYEAEQQFVAAMREGTFPEMIAERDMKVVVHSGDRERRSTIRYTGAEQKISFREGSR